MDEAKNKGWGVISKKNDWTRIFPFGRVCGCMRSKGARKQSGSNVMGTWEWLLATK